MVYNSKGHHSMISSTYKLSNNYKNGYLNVPEKVKEALGILTGTLSQLTKETDVMYCTGGFVRDMLLDLSFSDIDLAVDDRYFDEFIKMIKSLPTITGYGTDFAAVNGEDEVAEIELIRFSLNDCDFDLKRAVFGDKMRTDVLKRDFTINAVYLNPFTYQVIDPADYIEDLKNRTLRGVDSYSVIFIDRNRIMRAVRFKYKGFSFEPGLEEYMKNGAKDYLKKAKDVSDLQRLGGELRKCFASKHHKEILSELIVGDLLHFISWDKEVLLKSVEVVTLMKEILESEKWNLTVERYGIDRDAEDMLLIVYAYVFYFMRLYEAGIIKKQPFSQICKCMLKKSRVRELASVCSKLKKIAQTSDLSLQQSLLDSLIVEIKMTRESPTEIFLLAMLMKEDQFQKLKI